MALDVFQQVLAKLLEVAGGSSRQMVSIVDVLKELKLYGSSETILTKLHAEGWIADAQKADHVFVTPWGIEELRRASAPVLQAGAPAAKTAEPKNAPALREAAAKATELAALLEELATGAGGTPAQRKAKAKKAVSAVAAAVDEAVG